MTEDESLDTVDSTALVEELNQNANVDNAQQVQVKKVGKPVNAIWSLAFNDPEVHSKQKPNNAVCKHCKQSYRHHYKTSVVETHLRRCNTFKRLMLNKPVNERPDWWSKSKTCKTPKPVAISTSCSTSSQSSVRLFAVPKFTSAEQKKFNVEMAMHFYATGTSFVRVEDPHLLRAIQLARPDARLPTRKQLADDSSGGLLEVCYQQVKKDVEKKLSMKSQYVSVTSDAWSSVLNEPIINYMAVSPSFSLFLEAVHTEEQSHDAEWLTKDLIWVMDSLGQNVVGAITDNTSTNKKVWKELEQKYPDRFFHGCVSHGLHLLVKDILAATKKQSVGGAPAQYPLGYPFEDLLLFVADCKEVVSFFHNHHAPRAALKKALKQEKLNCLVQPAPTRWGTFQGCFKSLRAADSILNALVAQRDFVSQGNAKQQEKRAAIKEIITDPNFVTKLDECIKILDPIDRYIRIFQSDAVPCSEVYKAFIELEDQMRKLPNIEEKKRSYLIELVKKRFEFMYGDAHGVGYVLDPRFLGDKMSRSLRKEIEDFIFNFPGEDGKTTNERRDQLARKYTSFRIDALGEREQDSYRFKMIGDSKSVLQWWIVDATDWPLLRNLAIRVFSMATSSAASERNFSTFGFIHSKLRNRLSQEKVKKLVYIKTNVVQMADSTDCYVSDCSDTNELNEDEEVSSFMDVDD